MSTRTSRPWRAVVKVWRNGVWFNQLECGHTFKVNGTKTNANAKRRICHDCEEAAWRAKMGLKQEPSDDLDTL
jgi:hypothetical protein